MEQRLARREGRPPVPAYEGDAARRFGVARCARAYKVAKELALVPASGF